MQIAILSFFHYFTHMFKKRESVFEVEEGRFLSPKFDSDGLGMFAVKEGTLACLKLNLTNWHKVDNFWRGGGLFLIAFPFVRTMTVHNKCFAQGKFWGK